MSKALVLLSGGQDSTTCLYWARTMFDEVEATVIFYGQRHSTELQSAGAIARLTGTCLHRLDVPALGVLADSDLVREGTTFSESGGRADAAMPNGLPSSFVPGRNALFFTMAAALAVKLGIRDIVTGTCQTDYSGYPDCRREFVDAMERSLSLAMPSSCGPLRILTPLMYLTKAETVRMARRLPGCWDAIGLTTSCYNGKRPGCMTCPSCVLRARGFAEANEVDPAR